jgi:hypothetical protein
MNKLFLICLVFSCSYVSAIESLSLKNSTSWKTQIRYSAPASFNGVEAFLSEYDQSSLVGISQEDIYNKYMNEEEQLRIKLTIPAPRSRNFLFVRDRFFLAIPSLYELTARMNSTSMEDGTYKLNVRDVSVTVVSDVTLFNGAMSNIESGVVIPSFTSRGWNPKLVGTVDPQEYDGVSKFVIDSVQGKRDKQVMIKKWGKLIPLAYISETEKPEYGSRWSFQDGSQIFILTLKDTAPAPEGMGSWCKSRTVTYKVDKESYTQLSDAGFQCYFH